MTRPSLVTRSSACLRMLVYRPDAASWLPIWNLHIITTHIPLLPVTELLTARSLVLPLFHDLTEEQQDTVVAAVCASQDHSEAISRSTVKVP